MQKIYLNKAHLFKIKTFLNKSHTNMMARSKVFQVVVLCVCAAFITTILCSESDDDDVDKEKKEETTNNGKLTRNHTVVYIKC